LSTDRGHRLSGGGSPGGGSGRPFSPDSPVLSTDRTQGREDRRRRASGAPHRAATLPGQLRVVFGAPRTELRPPAILGGGLPPSALPCAVFPCAAVIVEDCVAIVAPQTRNATTLTAIMSVRTRKRGRRTGRLPKRQTACPVNSKGEPHSIAPMRPEPRSHASGRPPSKASGRHCSGSAPFRPIQGNHIRSGENQ
jgi:hypothetical protein